VFGIYLRTNSDLCQSQHKLIGFYNRDEKSCICSFGCLHGVRFSFANVSEPSVRSIFKGWMWRMKGSETSAKLNMTPWRHPKEHIQDFIKLFYSCIELKNNIYRYTSYIQCVTSYLVSHRSRQNSELCIWLLPEALSKPLRDSERWFPASVSVIQNVCYKPQEAIKMLNFLSIIITVFPDP
jgi:hypothetical protein